MEYFVNITGNAALQLRAGKRHHSPDQGGGTEAAPGIPGGGYHSPERRPRQFCHRFRHGNPEIPDQRAEKDPAEAEFFGEEDTEENKGASASGEYTFYIDPIDGTTNFMFRYNHSCVSVGLARREQMIAGFVYNPYVDEMFTAVRGKGSFLNGRKLEIRNRSVTEGIAAFGCARL